MVSFYTGFVPAILKYKTEFQLYLSIPVKKSSPMDYQVHSQGT